MELLMSLQGYVNQLRPRKESYVNYVGKTTKYIIESSLSKGDKKNTISSYRIATLEIAKTSCLSLKKPNLFEQCVQMVFQLSEEEFL